MTLKVICYYKYILPILFKVCIDIMRLDSLRIVRGRGKLLAPEWKGIIRRHLFCIFAFLINSDK